MKRFEWASNFGFYKRQGLRGAKLASAKRIWAFSALCAVAMLRVLNPIDLAAQSLPVAGPSTPYAFPVVLPPSRISPADKPAAPYTPLVVKLIRQLEPHSPPTLEDMVNASALLSTQGGTYEHPKGENPTCHNLANVALKTVTTPSIMPLCFSDGLGLNVVSGPNVGKTTGLPSMLMLASSFDRELANALGQVEGLEGRNLMVTGLLGPQADTDVFLNWGRGHHTPGEDPYLNGEISAAQINGIQGQGLMAQVKHFAAYYGAGGRFTDVQDQALHEMILTPYEIALTEGGASSIMCSYQKFRDASPFLPGAANTLTQTSPFPGVSTKTWPLHEVHYACENPLLLNYVLRRLWRSKVFVATDYGAAHSTHGFLQGDDREDPSATYFAGTNPEGRRGGKGDDLGIDASSSTCADANGKAISCDETSAVRVSGIPGPGCPTTGCGLAQAVANGTVPLSVFNQALARVLYQEERFGFLGCNNSRANCRNPGGMGMDRSGVALLAEGDRSGTPQLGTKYGDAAIAERVAEEGGVLLKNENQTLPITSTDLKGGIAVSGAGAEYLVANPNNEGASGFADRNAINPLEQLKVLAGMPSAFMYTPANSPTGQAVPCSVLSSMPSSGTPPVVTQSKVCTTESGLQRAAGVSALINDQIDGQIDYSSTSSHGQLSGGKVYRWDGWIYVPAADSYVYRIQHSTAIQDSNVTFTLDGSRKTLVNAASFYQGQWYGNMSVVVSPTNAGYIEGGLRSRQCAGSRYEQSSSEKPIVACDESPSVGWHKVTLTVDASRLPLNSELSFRFAYSRARGDIVDAAAAAEGKAMAVVFVDDQGRNTVPEKRELSSLNALQLQLVKAVAAKNPHTVVVINTGTPFIVKEWINDPNVKAVLNMWQTGQEGGVATARLLLGQANPSGHLTLSWPKDNTDTVYGYDQPAALYPGDTPGTHPERLKGIGDEPSKETQGIYSGYRYYDRLGLPVQFPFGYGLSYTSFKFSALTLTQHRSGTLMVEFDVRNTGSVSGTAVPQIYVGPGPTVAAVQQAVRSLRGFDRVPLEPGQTKHVKIRLDERSFQYWSERGQRWITNPGPRTIFVGEADGTEYLPLSASITIAKTDF